MAELDPLLELARRVACEARALGIESAVIGAMALAHYGYVRATVDVDLATFADFSTKLRALGDRLEDLGLEVERIAPDDEDPLGGMLRVRRSASEDPVDVINFRGANSPGALAVERARMAADGFRYVELADLVALKLYAGSKFDRDDVARVLVAADDVDLDEVRRVCRDADLGEMLEPIIRELLG